jgi:hypothetical protein
MPSPGHFIAEVLNALRRLFSQPVVANAGHKEFPLTHGCVKQLAAKQQPRQLNTSPFGFAGTSLSLPYRRVHRAD